MKQVKRTFFVIAAIVAACFFGTNNVKAQEFTVQGDLVSSYVWRGVYQTGASFQPTLGFGIGGFSLCVGLKSAGIVCGRSWVLERGRTCRNFCRNSASNRLL